jgi:hypothetical protein
MWDYLDHELGESRVAAIDAHLARCDYCHEHLRFAGWLLERIQCQRPMVPGRDALTLRVIRALACSGRGGARANDVATPSQQLWE